MMSLETMPCHVLKEAKADLIALLEDLLLPNALDAEMKVFFLKSRAATCPKGWGWLWGCVLS